MATRTRGPDKMYLCTIRATKSTSSGFISLNLRIACATVDSPGTKTNFLGETISSLAFLLFANPLTLLEQTSGVARVILGLLLFLSVFSWALILQKSYQLGGIDRKTARFLQMFRSGRGLSDPNTLRAGVGGTPLISVYAAGYRELEQQIGGPQSRVPAGANKIRNANAVGVEMQVAAGEEVRRLEKGMSTLGHHRLCLTIHRTIRHSLGRDGRILGPGRRRARQVCGQWRQASPKR